MAQVVRPSRPREVTHYLIDRWPDNLYVWLAADRAESVLQLRDELLARLRVVIDCPTQRVITHLPGHVPQLYRWYLRIREPREGLAAEAEWCLGEMFAPPPPLTPAPLPSPPKTVGRPQRATPPPPPELSPRAESFPASDRRCAHCNGFIAAARVEAVPDCRLCVSCQERAEQAGGGSPASSTDPGEQWFPRSECWRSKARRGPWQR